MGPELRVLLVVAAVQVFAYAAVYPRLKVKTMMRLMKLERVISALLILAVGWVYAGSGIGFSVVLFDVPWWAFTLISGFVVEIPLFLWFSRRYGIDPGDLSDR